MNEIDNFPCKTPLFVTIQKNSTVSEVLTPCLSFVLLPTSLALFSFWGFLFLIFYGFCVISPKLKITKLLITKSAISFAIALLALSRWIWAFIYVEESESEYFISTITLLIESLSALACYARCWHSGIPSSIWLHLIWFCRLLSLAPEAIVLFSQVDGHMYKLAFLEIEIIFVILLNILFCFADEFDESFENFTQTKEIDPDRTSSSLARAFFAQAGQLMSKGYKNTIDYESFWSLDPRNQPERLLSLYRKHYTSSTSKSKKFPWLFFILFKSTWFLFAAGVIITALDAIITFADPIFLKLIISSAENGLPLWYGFSLVIGALLVSIVKLSMMARSDFYTLLSYLNIQSILMNVIYQKILKLSPSAKAKYSAGEAVNLVFTDVERIAGFWYHLLDMVYSPIMISVCLIGLFFIIGHNVLYGIAVIVAFLPANAYLIKLANKFEEAEMKFKDDRLKLMTDVLSGVKVLKFYAWEKSMHSRISEIRCHEATQRKYGVYCYSMVNIMFNSCPIFATIASLFGFLILQGNALTPQVAFLSLMLFNLMRFSIYSIPSLVQEIINARISLNRVQDFLMESEMQDFINTIDDEANLDQRIIFEARDASYSWNSVEPEAQQPTLKSLNFKIFEGELIGIIGRVGSGKSSLLSAICGEIIQGSGQTFRKPSISIAFSSQESWIQNMSLQSNILFGKPFEEHLYRRTIEACELSEDLKQLPGGDATEIGEKGLNLSGGQKARVALARAVYQMSDLYILDDTLSAVDSHVGAHIFQNVIGNSGILKGKTKIFALNSINYLPQCDRIFVMKEGNIVDIGTFEELKERKNETFVELVKEFSDFKIPDDKNIDTIAKKEEESVATEFQQHHFQEFFDDNPMARLIEDEEIAVGKVSAKVYFSYIKAFGIASAIIYFFTTFILRTFFESFSQIWMAKWSAGFENSTKITNLESLEIYGIFSLLSCIVTGAATILVAYGSFQASQKLHDNLLFSLLRSPMSFFDTTPIGRILNRLSKDIEKVDNDVPFRLSYSATLMGECTFYLISAMFFIPQLGILSIFVFIIFVMITRYFTYTSVQIRRLCSAAWSSLASHLQDSYSGVSTLRVFSVQDRFTSQMMKKGITAIEADLAELVCNKWIELRMAILTSLFTSVLTGIAIYFGNIGWITAGAVGLVTSTGTMLRNLLGNIARTVKDMEMSIVAVERVQEYCHNDSEAEWETSSPILSRKTWPSEGNIKFCNFSLRYRPSTPLVLKGLDFEIKGGEKVGVVGRTGAGKTSLTMALFRMIEPSEGTILIDSLDFRSLGLHDLRNALTIIPQDPILFCGKLRSNLDTFAKFSDSQLWDAIEKAHLQKFVNEFPDKLDYEISEGGGNVSVGQKQLICLARAILRKKTKILILDEATASIDNETDNLIQESIRRHFSQCTILTIAHRLNTIMDYDKVLVMDSGEIREYDSPQNLLLNKNGLFYSLAAQANLI